MSEYLIKIRGKRDFKKAIQNGRLIGINSGLAWDGMVKRTKVLFLDVERGTDHLDFQWSHRPLEKYITEQTQVITIEKIKHIDLSNRTKQKE